MGHAMVSGGARASAPAVGIRLGDIAEGSIVKINENGSPVDFYVAKHNYESGLNGTGRTLLVRKTGVKQQQWHSSEQNAYSGSLIDTALSSTFFNKLDNNVKTVIGTTAFYFTKGNGNNTVSTLSRTVFTLSVTEFGLNVSGYINAEGSKLPISSTLVSLTNTYPCWTRTPSIKDKSQAGYIKGSANLLDIDGTSGVQRYVLPCFTLPATTLFDKDTMTIKGVA